MTHVLRTWRPVTPGLLGIRFSYSKLPNAGKPSFALGGMVGPIICGNNLEAENERERQSETAHETWSSLSRLSSVRSAVTFLSIRSWITRYSSGGRSLGSEYPNRCLQRQTTRIMASCGFYVRW